jgi:hypothetical protein
MLRGAFTWARWARPGPEQMIKKSASCQRASSRKSSSEPPTADYENPAKVATMTILRILPRKRPLTDNCGTQCVAVSM